MSANRNCTNKEEQENDFQDKGADFECCLKLEMQVLEFKLSFKSYQDLRRMCISHQSKKVPNETS